MLLIHNNAAYRNQGKQEGINQTKVGTATTADVLTGKTFTNATGVGISGSMANKGAWTNTPTAKGKVTIPAGYHNGSGYIDTTSVYNKGMQDADARVNPNSASYTDGYNNGVNREIRKIEVIRNYRFTSASTSVDITSILEQNNIATNAVTSDDFLISKISCQSFNMPYHTLALSITYGNGMITIKNGQYSPGVGEEIFFTITIVCVVK